MRRLLTRLVLLGLLLGLLLLGDRALRTVAEDQVATVAASATGGRVRPEVSIGGALFLPQLVSGRYDEVTVGVREVPVRLDASTSLTLARLTATLRGVRVPLSSVVPGPLISVPVDAVTADATVAYPEVNRFAPRGVSVGPGGFGRVALTARLSVLGQDLALTAVGRLSVVEGALVVTADEVRGPTGLLDGALSAAVRGRLDVRVPLGPLPLGLTAASASGGADGLVVTATARSLVLRAP